MLVVVARPVKELTTLAVERERSRRPGESEPSRAHLPRQRLTCVPSMFDSLGVQVPCTT
jgi:hypothetical protein